MAEPMSHPEYASDATTLIELTGAMERSGFTGQFAAEEGEQIQCFTCRTPSPAAEVIVVDIRRTEGASDPDDMAAVAAVSCPKCQAKGTLVMHYGPEASLEEQDALRLLDDRRA